MEIRNLPLRFDIDYLIKDKWNLPIHKHTHYELQYILRGKGQHVINDHTYNYKNGDLFILTPQDHHFFIFQERSTICFIKFNEAFFEGFIQDLEFRRLLSNLSSPQRKILLSTECRENIGELVKLVMTTHKKTSPYQNLILKNTLSLIFALLMEDSVLSTAMPEDEKIQQILNYIDQHIKEKALLSVQNMASQFNISKTYFNQYFKRATSSTYKKYIQEYALNLIAHNLLHQDKTLSQLAFEFGYSDESHLSNSFKAHFRQTPSSFKKAHQQR